MSLSEREKEEILLARPFTKAFLQETLDTNVWVKALYPHWIPIDARLKETLGNDWPMLVTSPLILKGKTPIELGGEKTHLLDPNMPPELHQITVNYSLFIGYELGDQLKILTVLPDVLSMLERRGAGVSLYSRGYRALVGTFIQKVMNIGAGIRQMVDNPTPHPHIGRSIAELLEKELGIERPGSSPA